MLNSKVAIAGFAMVTALLIAMSSVPIVVGLPIPGPFKVSIPRLDLSTVVGYGAPYEHEHQPGEVAPVLVLDVDSVDCPKGVQIVRTIHLLDTDIHAKIDIGKAYLSGVLMKANNLDTSWGNLNSLKLETMEAPESVSLDIDSGTMHSWEANVYFLSLDSMNYEDLAITITPEKFTV